MKSSEQVFLVEHESGGNAIEVRDVCKETPGKESKRGRFHIALDDGVPKCFKLGDQVVVDRPNMLETFYQNGQLVKSFDNIDTVRERVNYWRGVYNF
jgi:hypothetical protein